jgi:exoribonuclease R
VISIDNASTRDIDDALSFEFQGAGQEFWKVLAQPNFTS